MKKRSFFDRLSGPSSTDEYDGYEDEFPVRGMPSHGYSAPAESATITRSHASVIAEEEQSEGQLPVDVYQTANEIIIRTFVAGVRPDDLNVSISRDMVVIEGAREERDSVIDSDYFTRELFWGSFSRTILLPQEIDVDESNASAKDGLLTVTLPKMDKTRQTKLRVKAG